ncbi:unnamed protein product [Litomosoides sigmodontis]|uniref:Uncharacterized protein n=1 Tax=Litomosoides sigmodontis TaxID=42156 RepID=A0A3P6TPJ4_LITSI|nr:unnamed protein product [Litomosoides sigmodontis]
MHAYMLTCERASAHTNKCACLYVHISIHIRECTLGRACIYVHIHQTQVCFGKPGRPRKSGHAAHKTSSAIGTADDL